ncbi:MAG: hypothetical protein HY897_19565, partial [Deltaproteobacteria bacterium]|nr:hypothetical protein [Deltaproteobacteria bacterium]
MAFRRSASWISCPFVLSLPLVIALGLFGCSSDLSVPSEAQLGCASAADCPSGWACNEKVSRCIKTENIDSTAPAIQGEVTVAPAVLKKGAKATVTFSVSEELSKPPVVTVNAGTDRLLTLASHPAGRDEANGEVGSPLAYVFSYAAAGDEPQNVESAISIVLTDKSGNESGKLSGKSVKFDFIKPEVPADKVFVTGSPAKKDGVVTVKFTVSEPLAAAPVVNLTHASRLTPLALDAASSGVDYVFTYTAAGTDPEDPAGLGLTVDLADEAGNAATVKLEKTILFDFTAPSLAGEPVVQPPVAKAGSLVSVTFEASEELSGDPVVTLGTVLMSKGGASGKTYTYSHV